MLSLAAEEEFELSTGAQCLIRPNAGSGRVGVVSLHPWGPLGGSLDDPHVRAVTQFFGKGGCATCRVQFRSGFGRGEASVDDAVAAAGALLAMAGVDRVVVVGYSYGACVAMRAAFRLAPGGALAGWAALNPPLDYAWFLFAWNWRHLDDARATDCPKLLLHATADVFCSNGTFDAFAESLGEGATVLRAPGAIHFDLRSAIAPALGQWLREGFRCADAGEFARRAGPVT